MKRLFFIRVIFYLFSFIYIYKNEIKKIKKKKLTDEKLTHKRNFSLKFNLYSSEMFISIEKYEFP